MPVITPGSSDSPQPPTESHDHDLDSLKDAIKDLVQQVNDLVTQPKPDTGEVLRKWLLWILILLILLFLLLLYSSLVRT
jgi:type II secretory pathway component PulL